MKYYKNQFVNIIKNKEVLKVVAKQNSSTPGMYFLLELNEYEQCKIFFTGYKKGNSKVRLWISFSNNKCIEFTDKNSFSNKIKTLQYNLKNNTADTQTYKIGLLFSKPKLNDYFYLNNFKFIKTDIASLKNIIKEKKKKSKYLYVYYYKKGNGHKNTMWQIFIRDNIKDYLDKIQITSLNSELLEKYDVVIIDFFSIARYNPLKNRNVYLDELKKCKKCKIAIYLHDMHEYTFLVHKSLKPNPKNNKPNKNPDLGVTHFIEFLKSHNIRYLISRCQCPEFDNILKAGETVIEKHFYLTHHVDSRYFKNYNLKKEYDVVMFGTCSNNSYPFRARIKELLMNSKNKDKLRIKIIPRKNAIYNDKLSKLLNKSWMAVATKSNFNYLVCKYFEISASKCVILGDMTKQGSYIWKNNYVHIDNSMSDDAIINKIEYYINNKKILSSFSENMYNIIHKNFTYQIIGLKMFCICESINGLLDIGTDHINNINLLKEKIIYEHN